MTRKSNRFFGCLRSHPYLWAFAGCLAVNAVTLCDLYTMPANAVLLMGAVFSCCGIFCLRHLLGDEPSKRALILSFAVIMASTVCLCAAFSLLPLPQLPLMAGLLILCLLFYAAFRREDKDRAMTGLIMLSGFAMRVYYVLITRNDIRQHDIGSWDGGGTGHADYILWIRSCHFLPDVDVREFGQFYHPPLHHIICAAWLDISESIFGIPAETAQGSLQTLTLFYTCAMVIVAYKLFREFGLSGKALHIPLAIVSVHPSLVYLAGSLNNDALSSMLMWASLLLAVRWYKDPSVKNIALLALSVGSGMFSKFSVGVIAPSTALLFLAVLIKNRKSAKKLLCEYAVFGALCIPLGIGYQIKNLVRYGVPLNYILRISEEAAQYIGHMAPLSRVTDFSMWMFDRPFKQLDVFSPPPMHGEAVYWEYNPLVAALKTAMFGEYFDETDFLFAPMMLAKFLLFVSVALAAIAFISMIAAAFTGKGDIPRLYMLVTYIVIMVSYYVFCIDHPAVCTEDFRYITPTLLIGALSLGIISKESKSRAKLEMVLTKTLTVLTAMFSAFFLILLTGIERR
ncbi:MAG: glycosyltransferase family 39 protein [Oscillospiraceae bacterium]|nr:glycosyltransferase family 39 protein [Oscillospiraceae bacterium]